MGIPRVLRVRAREGIVMRYDLIDQGVKRFVGRRYVPNAEAANGFAFEDTGETVELPYMKEFVDAIRHGSLWAADEATAEVVWGDFWRDHFDASFGTAPKATASAWKGAE